MYGSPAALVPKWKYAVAVNVLLYLQPEALRGIVPSISDACLQPYQILQVCIFVSHIIDLTAILCSRSQGG